MQTGDIMEYHGCEVRPVVTPTKTGRYAAAAIVTGRVGDTRTLAVEGDLSNAKDARNEASNSPWHDPATFSHIRTVRPARLVMSVSRQRARNPIEQPVPARRESMPAGRL